MSGITPGYREYQFRMHIYNNAYTQEDINLRGILEAAYWATSERAGIYCIPRKEGIGMESPREYCLMEVFSHSSEYGNGLFSPFDPHSPAHGRTSDNAPFPDNLKLVLLGEIMGYDYIITQKIMRCLSDIHLFYKSIHSTGFHTFNHGRSSKSASFVAIFEIL